MMNKINIYLYKTHNEKLDKSNFFSNYRSNKIKDITNDKVYETSLISEHLLYYALKNEDVRVDKLEIETYEYGKPYFKNLDKYFNISHSMEYVVVGLSNLDLAVDIQMIDSKYLKISKKLYYNNNNNIDINQVIRDFTIKEAFIKYYGKSILYNLKDINIDDNYVSTNLEDSLSYKSYLIDNYYLTVVSKDDFMLNINKVNNLST